MHDCTQPSAFFPSLCNSYTMGCPPVRGDNPRALASGLSYVEMDKHGIPILYHLHQCRPCTSRDIHAKVGKGGIKPSTPSSPSRIVHITVKVPVATFFCCNRI